MANLAMAARLPQYICASCLRSSRQYSTLPVKASATRPCTPRSRQLYTRSASLLDSDRRVIQPRQIQRVPAARYASQSSSSITLYSGRTLEDELVRPGTGFGNGMVTHSACTPLKTRRLISVWGVDAPRFLQGLTTNTIPSPTSQTTTAQISGARGGFYSAFLNAAGRVLHDVFIYPAEHSQHWQNWCAKHSSNRVASDAVEPAFMIEVDANEIDALCKHLSRFKLRSNVSIRKVEVREWTTWALWGDETNDIKAELGKDNNVIAAADERVPDGKMGLRMLLPRATKPPTPLPTVDAKEYLLRRILLGVPEGQHEIISGVALPQETNLDYMGAIDFRKGCYIGQELTIRTHHTGVVRKRIVPCQIYVGTTPMALTPHPTTTTPPITKPLDIFSAKGKNRTVGKWLIGAENVGLAVCRLEVMTDVIVTSESARQRQEHLFGVGWENEKGRADGEFKVKAFVPSWHKVRAEEQSVRRPAAE